MLLIKSKIYFSEIQKDENLISVIKYKPKRDYPLSNAHQYGNTDILHFFIKSGYIKLAYYAVKKLLKITYTRGYNFDVSLSASTSGNLDVIKLLRPRFETYNFRLESVFFLSQERRPDIIDYLVEDKSLYDGLEEKEPAIYQYYCAQEFSDPNPRLKIRSNFSGKILGYVFVDNRTIKDGYHFPGNIEFEVRKI